MFSLCNCHSLHRPCCSRDRREQWLVLMTGSRTWQRLKNRLGIKYFCWGNRSSLSLPLLPPSPSQSLLLPRSLSLPLFLSSFTTTIIPEWVSEVCFVCVSQSRLKSCLCIWVVMRKRVWMSVLLVDECCGSECAEGDRSLRSQRGLLTVRLSNRQQTHS